MSLIPDFVNKTSHHTRSTMTTAMTPNQMAITAPQGLSLVTHVLGSYGNTGQAKKLVLSAVREGASGLVWCQCDFVREQVEQKPVVTRERSTGIPINQSVRLLLNPNKHTCFFHELDHHCCHSKHLLLNIPLVHLSNNKT